MSKIKLSALHAAYQHVQTVLYTYNRTFTTIYWVTDHKILILQDISNFITRAYEVVKAVVQQLASLYTK